MSMAGSVLLKKELNIILINFIFKKWYKNKKDQQPNFFLIISRILMNQRSLFTSSDTVPHRRPISIALL
jgi:hypothetical protein